MFLICYTEDINDRKGFVMEFCEKLQELRKKKGMTQEDLAQALYVSRTAVSKWESGRGYPNMESLRRLAALFSVTVDDLLSANQLLCLAEEDHRRHSERSQDVVFGLLDMGALLLLFLPFFAQRGESIIQEVSLLDLTGLSPYLRMGFLVLVAVTVLWGILTLCLQTSSCRFWGSVKRAGSVVLTALGVLLFMLCLHPYAAVFLFVFLLIKVFLLMTRKVS